jgi:D-alanine transaminase
VAYVDGRYARHGDAAVHIEDRGLQFADSVYEVVAVSNGVLLDASPHFDRLARSLNAIGMAMPVGRAALEIILHETARRNRLREGFLYLQVTRGAASRDHAAPIGISPSLIVTAKHSNTKAVEARRAAGIAVITTPDIRWGRCDIKSTALLPNVMAKTEARSKDAFEAWFVDADGFISEGSSSNAWIVAGNGTAITRSHRDNILPGVTRAVIMDAMAEAGLSVEERAFSLDEAMGAAEAFISSATGGVMPVVRIDGKDVGDGLPGPMAMRMHLLYRALSLKDSNA